MSRAPLRTRAASRIDRLSARTWLLGTIAVTVGATITVLAAVSTNGVPLPPAYTFVMEVSPDAPPLKVAAPVRIAGKRAGSVTALTPERDGLRVEVAVDRRYAPIGRDARVTVRASAGTSLTYLVVRPGDPRDPIPDGGTLAADRIAFASSLPQSLETFDAEVRAALQRNLTVPGAALRGRGAGINRSLARTRRSVEDGSALSQQVASLREPGTLRESLRNAGTVYDALTGTRPDDLGATITAAARIAEAGNSRKSDTVRSLRGSAALQAAAPPVLDDLDRATASATVLFEQAAPLLQALRSQAGDVQAILEAGPDMARDAATLRALAGPVLESLRRTAGPLRRTALGVEPVLRALADISAGLTPYTQEIRFAGTALVEAGRHKGLDGDVLRVSPGFGCHSHQNPAPAPGKVSEDRLPC